MCSPSLNILKGTKQVERASQLILASQVSYRDNEGVSRHTVRRPHPVSWHNLLG